MKIKPFNRVWWGLLVLQAIIITVITLICQNLDETQTINVLRGFNIFEGIYLFFYKFALSKDKSYNFNIWDDLPFYLCNIATITAIIASFTDTKFMMCYCFTIGSFGAFMAYVYPDELFTDIPMISIRALGFYLYHGLLMCTGILFVTTGIYVPSYADIPWVLLYIAIVLFVVHLINTLLRKTVFPQANYSFTYGARGNAVLQMIYDKCPVNLLYLYLTIPLFAVYIVVLIFIARLFI